VSVLGRIRDCRIIFAFEPDPETGEEMIALVDPGTHDEVY